jgi:Peptidase family M23
MMHFCTQNKLRTPVMTRFVRLLGLMLILPVLSSYQSGNPEEPVPHDYFIAPVETPLLVTGTFCELRPNHFHSGLDIKSKNGAVGQPIFAAAAGYIDQIKVQASGYGNVLYVKHPNGYTTVYAHLDRFMPEVAEYVKSIQYDRERFEVVIDVPKDRFAVRKGEEIGKMGNSGSSTGPHLHFEIRNSRGASLNPLSFNMPVPDTRPPDVRDMKLYYLDAQRQVVHQQGLAIERRKDGTYGLKGGVDMIALGATQVGLGVKTYDESNALRNDNGIYQTTLRINEQLAYQWTADALDFDETRYLNALADYGAKQRYGAWFHRLFVLPGDQLSMYARTQSMGSIALSTTDPARVEVEIKDAAGNTALVRFQLLRSEYLQAIEQPPHQQVMSWAADNRFTGDGITVEIGKNTLYEDLYFRYETSQDASYQVYSPVHHLHKEDVPVHKYFDVGIIPTIEVPAELRSKAVIARCGDHKPDNCGGKWEGSRLTTRIRSFGDYCVMIDDQPPTITPIVFDDDMRRKTAMSFRIDDNFNVSDQGDRMTWRGTIDDQWVLFELDIKKNRLTHHLDSRTPPGEHTLRLVVKDDRGNQTVLERQFVR